MAGGRRFKYPVQYTKHRLVFTALAIGLALVVLFLSVSWWQLYRAQTTDAFYYRVTRVVPLPVAKVDDTYVKYGDYLLNYRMSETYLNTAEKANEARYADGGSNKSLYDFYKAQAMDNAVTDAYAHKLAKEYNISISDEQIDQAIKALIQTSSGQSTISQEVIDRSVEQLYGLSPAENRYYLRESMLRQAIAYHVDGSARKTSDEIKQTLEKRASTPFEEIVTKYEKTPHPVQVLSSGWVKKDNKDGGLAAEAAKLKKDEVSGPIKPLGGDGYYFVKLIDTNSDGEINYQFIKVPLKQFKQQLEALKKEGKVQYYIEVPSTESQVQTN